MKDWSKRRRSRVIDPKITSNETRYAKPYKVGVSSTLANVFYREYDFSVIRWQRACPTVGIQVGINKGINYPIRHEPFITQWKISIRSILLFHRTTDGTSSFGSTFSCSVQRFTIQVRETKLQKIYTHIHTHTYIYIPIDRNKFNSLTQISTLYVFRGDNPDLITFMKQAPSPPLRNLRGDDVDRIKIPTMRQL